MEHPTISDLATLIIGESIYLFSCNVGLIRFPGVFSNLIMVRI